MTFRIKSDKTFNYNVTIITRVGDSDVRETVNLKFKRIPTRDLVACQNDYAVVSTVLLAVNDEILDEAGNPILDEDQKKQALLEDDAAIVAISSAYNKSRSQSGDRGI